MKGLLVSDTSREQTRFPKVPAFISIVCAALTLGLTLTHVLEIPGQRQLRGGEFLTVQHTFYGGFAIVGAISEMTGFIVTVGTLIFVLRNRKDIVQVLTAALCFLGTLLSYWFGNRPINAKIALWTPATLPANWTMYRNHWEYAHSISAGFSAIALVILLVYVLQHTEPCA
ncbi:hypothetical protein [Alicyclobacillus acidiphilus]|uniref:hypothetical protein n=1 Tax=Alicyclobacillus acidiphilus TaxID=182455 RepID=UPI000A63F469|nr:hypothetical protein [Alicyclobacillus acidiphilus]